MWSPTKLQITLIGILIDETYKTMRSAEPDKFKQIGDQFTDIAAGADTTVVQNEQGELALCCEGQYYPIQSGSWVQEETFMDDDEPEEVEYNALVPFEGLNHLLMIESIVKVCK